MVYIANNQRSASRRAANYAYVEATGSRIFAFYKIGIDYYYSEVLSGEVTALNSVVTVHQLKHSGALA